MGEQNVRLIGGTSLDLRFLPLVAGCNFTTELSVFQYYHRIPPSKQQSILVEKIWFDWNPSLWFVLYSTIDQVLVVHG